MSDEENNDDEITFPIHTNPPTRISKSELRQSLNRLPRVIADANNLSFDGGYDMDLTTTSTTTQRDSLLLKTVHSNHSSGSSSTPSPKHLETQQITTNDDTTTTSNKPNGVKSNIALESQEITKILLANPNLFMEFLATVQAKDKTCNINNMCREKSNSNDTGINSGNHSRHTSCERSLQHSRHSSNGQSQNSIGQSYHHSCNNSKTFGATELRPNRCSCDSQRYIPHQNRTNNSSDDLVGSGSPRSYRNNGVGSSKTLRSQSSADGSSSHQQQIFTIDSYSSRNTEQNYTHQNHQSIDIDTGLQQQQQQQFDPHRSYYHEMLSQKSSIDPPQQQKQQHQQNNSNDVTHKTHHENVVVQRGYNNDYIVPLMGPTSYTNSSSTTNFAISQAKPSIQHRNNVNEGSPVRRTSPNVVAYSQQNVQRFQQQQQPGSNNNSNPVITTSSGVDYRGDSTPKTSVSSINSNQGGGGILPRKPPPNYESTQRKTPSDLGGSEDESSPTTVTPQREIVNIDANFMWKMTQKYCEPRIRKNPPPSYNASISDFEGGVILRKKSNKSFNRSRPHSYTAETGITMFGDGCTMSMKDQRVIQPTSLSMDNADLEGRKHPKRTHSMPAVKQPELRPVAAQSFLAVNPQTCQTQQPPPFEADAAPYLPNYSQQLSQPSQQPPQYSQHLYHYASSPPQMAVDSVATLPQVTTTHYNTENVTTAVVNVDDVNDTDQNKTPNGQLTGEYEQAPKKLRTRQQRAEDSFNRRKSIDSGTLRKLAEEMHENPAFGGEYPILSQLLGESQFTAIERRSQGLYRYKSTEALYSQF